MGLHHNQRKISGNFIGINKTEEMENVLVAGASRAHGQKDSWHFKGVTKDLIP